MKDDDLTKNVLLDDGIEKTTKVAKKAMNRYQKAQRWMVYTTIAKWSVIVIAAISILWGASVVYNATSDMISNIVVVKAKEVPAEKTEGQNLTSAIVRFAKGVDTKINEAADAALIENGFDPDAPANCALQDAAAPSSTCLQYSNIEVDGTEYTSMQLWDTACPTAYGKVAYLLKTTRQVTHNQYRKLFDECDTEMNINSIKQRDDRKQQIIDRFNK